MFKNYLKVALRNIKRQKGYAFINVAGLAMGMTVGLLILLWVLDEINVNKFHDRIDALYIVGTHSHQMSAGTPPALGPALKAEYPEIVNSTRFVNGYANMVLSYGEKRFYEGVRAADPSVLEMFSFPLLKGSIYTVWEPEADEFHRSVYLQSSLSSSYSLPVLTS